MQFNLKIDCDNDAFAEDPAPELARILRLLADRMDSGEFAEYGGLPLVDANGNAVGHCGYSQGAPAKLEG